MSAFSTRSAASRHTNSSCLFGRSTPGQQSCFAEDLEPVADAEHGATRRSELADRVHHRCEARDRARAQVVAVRETARAGRRLRCRAGARRPGARRAPARLRRRRAPRPHRDRRSSPGRRRPRRAAWPSLVLQQDLVALDERVREKLGAHPLDLRARVRPFRPPPARGRRRARFACSGRRSRACEASPRTASPCGSRMPSFGRTSTVAFTARPPGWRGTRRRRAP